MRGPFPMWMPDLSPTYGRRSRVRTSCLTAPRAASEAGDAQRPRLLASGPQPLAILASAPLRGVTQYAWPLICGDAGPQSHLQETIPGSYQLPDRTAGSQRSWGRAASAAASERASTARNPGIRTTQRGHASSVTPSVVWLPYLSPTHRKRLANVNTQTAVELTIYPRARAVPDPRLTTHDPRLFCLCRCVQGERAGTLRDHHRPSRKSRPRSPSPESRLPAVAPSGAKVGSPAWSSPGFCLTP